eukprot:TRINITY_DN32382_c0_g1_i1.p1 TRINITY_DN32382_c0_g1~~TRINITY_DN32382_c0_g1_i1.p1  ORF type:complete len:516 (+),score=47.16 TRINITY_DN32382_c0_g1_i1:46-1593(+)
MASRSVVLPAFYCAFLVACILSCCIGVAESNGWSSNERVRLQYEQFPYPDLGIPLSSADCSLEKFPQQNLLRLVDHFVFDGSLRSRSRLHASTGLRILVVGGGTGRDTITLAKELIDFGIAGSVTHFDISQASVNMAEKWSRVCGVAERTRFLRVSLEDFVAQYASEARYHVILCSGVLHHLQDPPAGLSQLKGLLSQEGVIILMVYGKYGRAGIYEAQEAFRYALPSNELLSDAERMEELRAFLFGNDTSMPATSLLSLNSPINPHSGLPDDEIFDRLLHARDRAYSVLEMDELVRGAGLQVNTFWPAATYNPDFTVFTNPAARQTYMARRIRNRPPLEQYHFSELMTSRPVIHCALLTHSGHFGEITFKFQARLSKRRQDREWRRTHAVIIINPSWIQFGDQIPKLKQLAILRQHVPLKFVYDMPGKAVAHVPLPILSFAFMETALPGTLTAEEIITRVETEAGRWTRSWIESQPAQKIDAPAPLSYNEVADQFFEWLDSMESVVAALCFEVT